MLSGAGLNWYLRYPKEDLEPKETIKKAQDRPKSLAAELKSRGTAEISPHKNRNLTRNTNSNPGKRKSRIGRGRR